MATCYTYIMASKTGTLYVGMTNNLRQRVYEHKNHLLPGFTDAYDVTDLVYFETFAQARSAIAREKQLKGWTRAKKIKLIDAKNPRWLDLAQDWYTCGEQPVQSPSCATETPNPAPPKSS